MVSNRQILRTSTPTKWGVVPSDPASEMSSLKDPIVRVHGHLHFASAVAVSTQNLFPDLQTGPLPPQNVSIQMCGLFINKMCGLNAGLGH